MSCRLLLLLIISGLLIAGVLATTAHAQTKADALSIESVAAYRHLIEDNDVLIMVHYDIQYGSSPDEAANELYLCILKNDDVQIGSVLPYPYYDSGYGEGVMAFYYSADDAPVWGGTYTVTLQGNPIVWGDTDDWKSSYNMNSDDWSTYDDQETNQDALWVHIVSVAQSLETDWSSTLLDSTPRGLVLNTTAGEPYFVQAIIGLRTMCPDCFAVRDTTPNFGETDWSRAEDLSMRTTTHGTSIGNMVDLIARNMSVPFITAAAILVLVIYMFVIIYVRRHTGDAADGVLSGFPIIPIAVSLGFIPMAGYAVFALLSASLFGYIVFFRTS